MNTSLEKPIPWLRVILFMVVYLLNVAIMIFVVPAFKELFSSFGSEIPIFTSLLSEHNITIAKYLVYLTICVAGLLTISYFDDVHLPSKARFSLKYALALLVGILITIAIGVAMYLPILKMGQQASME